MREAVGAAQGSVLESKGKPLLRSSGINHQARRASLQRRLRIELEWYRKSKRPGRGEGHLPRDCVPCRAQTETRVPGPLTLGSGWPLA